MKKLLMCLLISFRLSGQSTGQNVVNAILAGPATLAPGSYIYSNLGTWFQNLGQTNHNLAVMFFNVTGTASVTGGSMQGSPNCTSNTYATVPPITVPAVSYPISQQFTNQTANVGAGATIYSIQGYGAYPCIGAAVTVTIAAASQATVIVYYQGTSSPAATLSDQLSNYNNIASISNALTVDNTVHFFTGVNSSISGTFVLYSLDADFDITTTDLQVGCSASAVTPAMTVILQEFRNQDRVGSTGNVVLPSSMRQWGKCPTSAVTPVYKVNGAKTTLNMSFRFE